MQKNNWSRFLSTMIMGIIVFLVAATLFPTSSSADIQEGLTENQYATDFSEYTVEEAPDDWSTLWRDTSQWTVLDSPSRLELINDSGGGRRMLTWDAAGELTGDFEISTLFRARHGSSVMVQLGLALSGDIGEESGYYVDLRNVSASSIANSLRINSYVDGSYTQLSSSGNLPFAAEQDNWYNVVFQKEGNQLQAKAWPYGEDEPEDFQTSVVDDNLNEGLVGIGHLTSGVENDFAFFGVGTGGEAAPRAPRDLVDIKVELRERLAELEAENLNEEDYTADSWETFSNALTEAHNLMEDESATQSVIDNALRELDHAYTWLMREGQPITGFEDRFGEEWTTLEEELEFIQAVSGLSDRVWYEEVGESVLGRPIYMTYVGAEQRTKEEVQDGRTIFIMGTPHGNEPAGREAAFKILRELAFTEDENMLEILENATVLIQPTSSPDSRAANMRTNANGLDNNRLHLSLDQPENVVTASILRDYKPDITFDAHERPTGSSPDIEFLWPRNLNVDREIYELNVELVTDYLIPDSEADGWSAGLYGSPTSAGRGGATNLRNMSGLRHGLGVLSESAGNQEKEDRVEMQMSSYRSLLSFYHERFDELAAAVDGASERKQADGANRAPFYLAGEDDTPHLVEIMDPPVCGYLLDAEQAESIELHIDLFELQTEETDDGGLFITMAQPMMTVIPFLMDERTPSNIIAGSPIEECPADKTELQEKIDEINAEALNEFDYTAESWGVFASALEAAESLLADEDATQTEADEALVALVAAYDGLVVAEVVDKSVIEEIIEEVSDLNESDYTAESWEEFASALEAAESVLEDEDVTQTDVESALIALLTAYVWLTADGDDPTDPVDKSALEEKIEEVSDLDASDYTEESWSTFASVLEEAENVLANEKATQEEVNDALADLLAAHAGLVEDGEDAADKSALQDKVNEANDLNAGDYTATSWAAVAEALEAADSVLADEAATQTEVNEALATLTVAIDGLVEAEYPGVDKFALHAKIIEASLLNVESYTTESWSAMSAALEAAESVSADETATQEEVNAALTALTEAIERLVKVEESIIDKSALEEKVEESSGLNASDYTEESWLAVREALEAAEIVLADETVTQEEVNHALADLTEGLEGLLKAGEEVVDKSALQDKVGEANGLNAKDYTTDSWSSLTEALEAAQNILEDESPTQEEVNAALAVLTEAIEGLEEKSSKPGDKDPSKVDGKDKQPGESDGIGSKEGSKLPSTATPYYNLLLIGFVLFVLGGIVWEINRRRRMQ
ncbi:M14 family zinc carboxypeptidase [Virgibacillus oceani]